MAENIRSKRPDIKTLIRDIEILAKNEDNVNTLGSTVSAANTLGRIYELSIDIADLGMPRIPI